MFQDLKLQAQYIKENFSDINIDNQIVDNLIIYVEVNKIIDFLTFLRDDKSLSFKTLLDLFGADMLGLRQPRFEVIYNLLSYKLNNRITIKVAINEDEEVPSAIPVFSSAGWFEREVYDMFGIKFLGHPDLRRILTDYDFEGYPLRKDFPLTGYKEVIYDTSKQKVVYKDVELMQEFRNFDFEMPWEGVKKAVQKDDV